MVQRLELPKLSNGKQSHEGKKEKKKIPDVSSFWYGSQCRQFFFIYNVVIYRRGGTFHLLLVLLFFKFTFF